DSGSYYFLSERNASTHVLISGASNLALDWQWSDLYFKFSNTSAFQIANSTGVTLRNFTLDYLTLPFTQVAITSVNSTAATIGFETLPGFSPPSDFNTNRAA